MFMFCPKCGNPDQSPETYCRQCGHFLHDFDKSPKKKITPQEHLTINTTLSAMTAVCSLTLALLLIVFLWGKQDVSPLIYLTTGFLFAMFAWQVQTVWRNILLKKQLKRPENIAQTSDTENTQVFPQNAEINGLLNEPDLQNSVPASVTEHTTTKLNKVIR